MEINAYGAANLEGEETGVDREVGATGSGAVVRSEVLA